MQKRTTAIKQKAKTSSSEIFESDSSDQDCPPPKTFKSRAQRFEDVLGILREGRLSPFDLMVELLDDSSLKYWAYRNELYKEENKKLSEILGLIFMLVA